jgi:hypothetical protein
MPSHRVVSVRIPALRGAAALAVLVLSSVPGKAQQLILEHSVSGSSYDGSAASKVGDSAILPNGRLETGGELVLLTAAQDLAGAEVQFTDVSLLPLHARMAVTPWLELGAGTQLLVKQSETMAEPLWQGANAALRVPFGSAFAGTLAGGGGPLLKDQGLWWQLETSLLTRLAANDWLRFELRAGYTFTSLHYSDLASSPTRMQEVMTHAEVQFGERDGGAWLGVDYFIPIDSDSQATAERPALDPNVRLNLKVGAVLSPRRTGWDLYVSHAFIDRGSVDRPGTTLPVLNGGFDQRQWTLGVQHRFDLYAKAESDADRY